MTWKEKILDIFKEHSILRPEMGKMTGKVTINFHEGKPTECVIEPVIRVK